MDFIIREMQTQNCYRQGEKVTAKTLTAAKRIATRRQVFTSTVLVIESADNGEVLAVKLDDGWHE